MPNEASAQTEEERERIAGERSEEKRWVEAMPPVALCAMHYDRDLNPQKVFGSVIPKNTAEILGLPLSCAVLLPERLCAVGYAEAKLGDKPNIDELIAWDAQAGLFNLRRYLCDTSDCLQKGKRRTMGRA